MQDNELLESLPENISIDLRDFLKEGNKIRTKFLSGSEWIINTITLVGIDTFEINLKVSSIISLKVML